jgi:phosphoglycerate dehydrogenase-like enzyme
MRITVAERKDATYIREGRVSFEDAIRNTTVVVIILPRTEETVGLIGETELRQMSQSAVLVNVSRGGIVDEAAVVAALRTRQIAGAAFDVFLQEPADSTSSPLLAADAGSLNLLATPHCAWLANSTIETLQRMVREGIEGWCAGHPVNVII